ncbi:MAG TPA: acyltransferase family protein [Acidimicrobiales bacterium]|nr:acyltransferase family protein [Acidimicrobiales bacterium]
MSATAGRRDGIDVARILALLLVVLGHLLLAVVDRRHGEVRGANLLALHPGWALVAVAAPMPVFFAAGGWANATSTLAAAAPRLRTLVGLGTVAVGAWSLAVLGTTVLNDGDSGIVGDGARVATQPLWFLAAYVPFAAAGGQLARLARHLRVVLPAVLATLLALDVARFGLDAPDWIGWPGFFLAWGTPWLLGAWWRHRVETAAEGSGPRFDERATGWALAVGGAVACVGLVHLAGYAPALIDAVPGARSNTTPPTLYTALAGVAQVGLLLVCAPALDRAGHRWRRFWSQAGEAAVGVYVWHLTALTLCVAAIAAGFPVPDRLTWLWWLTRPLWWVAILAVTAGFVALTAVVRARQRGRRTEPASPTRPTRPTAVVLGVAVTSAGAALVGLRGPRHAEMAVLCSALFGAGWLLLGARPARLRRAGR